jgi:hypothetical protein
MSHSEEKANVVTEEAVVMLAKEMYDKELHHLPFRDARHHLREIYLSRARETLEKSIQPVCTCWVTDERTWTTYGSSVEPGSQMEPNPDCPEHFPNPS